MKLTTTYVFISLSCSLFLYLYLPTHHCKGAHKNLLFQKGLGVTAHPQREPHLEKQFTGAFNPYFQYPTTDHRITECLRLEGTFKDHLTPTACHGQGHHPPKQAAQNFISLGQSQAWGSHSPWGKPVPLPPLIFIFFPYYPT